MKFKKIYITPFFVLLLTTSTLCFGQTNTSPYSILGIGDIQHNAFDYSTGMGNTGISLSSHRYIYDANPASLAFLDDHYFTMELASNFTSVNYSGNSILNTTTSNQMQIQRFVMGVKVKPFWGLSFGLKQFSSSNYSFYGQKNVLGTGDNLTTYYDGSGGINQVFLSNGFRIGRNFSIGLNSSYLFGSMNQTESLGSANITGSQLNTTNLNYYNHFYFEAGMQYKAKVSKKISIGLGAIASNKTTLDGSRFLTLTEGDPNVALPTNIINDSAIGTSSFNLPVMFGGGLSITYDNKLTLASDYKTQRWSDVHNLNGGYNYSFQNSSEFSIGAQYAPKKQIVYNNQLYEVEKYTLQAGGFYNTEYLQIQGQQIKDMGISLGVGVNSLRTSLGYMVNFQMGTRGTTLNNLVKENYFKVGLMITYRDLWRKKKFY